MPLRTLPAAHQHYYLHQPNLQSPEKRYLAILTSSLFHRPPLTGRNAGSRRRAKAAVPAKTSGSPRSLPIKGQTPRPVSPPAVPGAAGPGRAGGGAAIAAGALQKQPQMVSPHAASPQQPVTYTRASCEILERGEELTKMHIRAAAQLSPPPLQPSSSTPALPALSVRSFPSLLPVEPLQ